MNHTDEQYRDIPTILGLRSPAAWMVVVFVLAGYLVLAFRHVGHLPNPWAMVIAFLGITLGGFLIIRIEEDPLPMRAALALAGISPAISLLFATQLIPGELARNSTWFISAATFLICFTAIRGRIVVAWASMLAVSLIIAGWGFLHGLSLSFGFWKMVFPVNLLILATILSVTMRPVAQKIFALQEETLHRKAQQASVLAVLEERDQQLRKLDELVKPMLERIAQDSPLSDDERRECLLLEGQLRDSLRARSLAIPVVQDATRFARDRGIDVVLLDDGGLSGVDSTTAKTVFSTLADALSSARGGSVIARILPPGRPLVATILGSDTDTISRTSIDQNGSVVTDIEATG
ncbi:hypothetical protein IEU95_11855 [Hoyosella rhizosphaerae]|uniref:Uncharacterized protein n=1 Tax=Hoyosella rhizosphaerae TaxID=1755582 RepID=A0A916U833_9ACTN|nr:hypothetical protein [Hoyosella rhizosphaerae]MBN4927527.1 hypothetical protein [Hoyosella rhizosphaerae]GGC63796.1 hypothetical protein GCM10011410_15280 [Hoyosella rhizosphaerae]